MHKNEDAARTTAPRAQSPWATESLTANWWASPNDRMPTKKKTKRHKASQAIADASIYERQVRICKALANPTRLRILDLLGQQTLTVSGLQKALGIPLPNVSVQLATLRAAGVVATHKKGKEVHCSLALPEVRQACHFIRQVLRAQVKNAQNLPV